MNFDIAIESRGPNIGLQNTDSYEPYQVFSAPWGTVSHKPSPEKADRENVGKIERSVVGASGP